MLARLFLLLALPAATSSSGSVHTVIAGLEARYRHASTLQAKFLEIYRDAHGGRRAESGTVYFSKPGRMRWEYESPEIKLFLVDGTNVWFYVPADRVASRAKIKESSDWLTPLALLAGKARLGEICGSVLLLDTPLPAEANERPQERGGHVLRCLPKSSDAAHAPFREVILDVDESFHLSRVLIRELGGVETEFRFGDWKENIALPEFKFHFQPPQGVAIVNQEDLAASLH